MSAALVPLGMAARVAAKTSRDRAYVVAGQLAKGKPGWARRKALTRELAAEEAVVATFLGEQEWHAGTDGVPPEPPDGDWEGVEWDRIAAGWGGCSTDGTAARWSGVEPSGDDGWGAGADRVETAPTTPAVWA